MPYLQTLKDVINPELLVGGNVLKGESGCKDITINGNVVLLRGGHEIIKTNVLGKLFKDIKGYKKNADWIVFAENLVLICEMKTIELREYDLQLKNSKLLVDFLLNKIWLHGALSGKPPAIKHILFSMVGYKQASPNRLQAKDYGNGIQLYHLAFNSIYNLSQFI